MDSALRVTLEANAPALISGAMSIKPEGLSYSVTLEATRKMLALISGAMSIKPEGLSYSVTLEATHTMPVPCLRNATCYVCRCMQLPFTGARAGIL